MNSVIVIVFFLGMILVGFLSMRRITSADSYYVADRGGGTAAITGSLLATTVGGSSTIGLAGLGYQKGLVGAWWMLAGVVGLTVLSLWLAGRVRESGVYTLPGILEQQYGEQGTKIAASVLIVTAWLGIIAGQIVAAGKIMAVLWPENLSMLMGIAAAVFILYTVLGGQYSILRTDGIQALIIGAGTLVCFVASLRAAGTAGIAHHLPRSFFSFPVNPGFGWIDLLVFLLFVGSTFLVGPDIYSRVLCSRDTRTARRALLLTAAVMIPLAFLITAIGMSARVLFPEIAPESAFPVLIGTVVPAGFNGLVIAALLAAVMSSADTCLLTTGTIIAVDVVDPLSRSRINGKRLLSISRVAIILIGLLSLFIALKLRGVIASLLLGYTVFSAGLLMPVLFGFYKDRFALRAAGVYASIAGCGGLALALKLAGYDRAILITLPLSVLLLFAGSRLGRRWEERT